MKTNTAKADVEESIELLEEAADIRISISQMYAKYKELTTFMKSLVSTSKVSHKDIKNAVDAIHYFGGVGYPHPNSPGRMEELLDKMVGMVRVLSFIGRGDMVDEHLAKYGMVLKRDPLLSIKDDNLDAQDLKGLQTVCRALGLTLPKDAKKVSDVFTFGIDTLNGIQSNICQNSNRIRKEIKPTVKRATGMENEEVKRSLQVVRLKKKEKLGQVTKRRRQDTGSFKTFLSISKTVEGVRSKEDL
jgi:hypothetical protein